MKVSIENLHLPIAPIALPDYQTDFQHQSAPSSVLLALPAPSMAGKVTRNKGNSQEVAEGVLSVLQGILHGTFQKSSGRKLLIILQVDSPEVRQHSTMLILKTVTFLLPSSNSTSQNQCSTPEHHMYCKVYFESQEGNKSRGGLLINNSFHI